ncbi:hypothetical protein [Micromonospora lupini]|uniref:Uncharacterized protein n=1 Tax=Micromonospora lupini str. Lupac 08 TaxID=1150864 RepID=I0L3D3_9ACTN|nr:hypothetical protein [Micromonospora lupini]CCH18330.1 membrane hypothetical protein [Micromonospora lupini str. Lupac 08]
MSRQVDQQSAAATLATIHEHQQRTRRAARVPWWVYATMFLLSAAACAVNDFVDLDGTKLLAAVVLVVLVIVAVITFAGRSAPLSRLRAVQRRQTFVPQAFGVVAVVGGLGGWLLSRYGNTIADNVAGAIGLSNYPNTVAGILLGAAFTALFALSQLLSETFQHRSGR